jgi:hypothetical protein
MCTPRTPRDPLPKIGESHDSAERDGGDETPQRKHEEEWESLELDDSALQDSPAKAGDATAAPAPENAPGEGAPTASADAQEQAAETRASSEAAEGEDAASPGAADAAHDGASVGQGPTDAAADNGMTGAAEAEEAGGGGSGGSAAPEQDADESTASKEQAMPERIKTLKDYVEGRPSRSPRGVNLEQVKVSATHPSAPPRVGFASAHALTGSVGGMGVVSVWAGFAEGRGLDQDPVCPLLIQRRGHHAARPPNQKGQQRQCGGERGRPGP